MLRRSFRDIFQRMPIAAAGFLALYIPFEMLRRKTVGWDNRRSWDSSGVRRGIIFHRSSIENVLRRDGARFLGGGAETSVS